MLFFFFFVVLLFCFVFFFVFFFQAEDGIRYLVRSRGLGDVYKRQEGQQHMCLGALRRSAGFLQSKIAKGIDTRYTPRLTFELDEGVKKSLEMARILHLSLIHI